MTDTDIRPLDILLVEDSPSDAELTAEAMKASRLKNRLSVAEDGVEAMDFLRRKGQFASAPRPDLILLDLNLPRKDGRQVLQEIKADHALRTIPIVVLTASQAVEDVLQAYRFKANSVVRKPVDYDQFGHVVRCIESFWLSVVTLPPKTHDIPGASGAAK
jgi:two-component system, chemotaxis family, response regulator Rcp1